MRAVIELFMVLAIRRDRGRFGENVLETVADAAERDAGQPML